MSIPTEVPRTAAERLKAAEQAAVAVDKALGAGSLMKLGDRVGQPVPHIPTGIHTLDKDVLGIGGLPKGRIVEIYGPEGGGKTTITLTAIASAQAAGGLCAFIDAEHALGVNWAAKLGVKVD